MNRPILTGLVAAGFQIGTGLLATAGARLGYFDQDMATRITMVAIGLSMLVFANFASKVVGRSARSIAINRFAAWSLALGALAWTGIWLFAPMDVANVAATAAVALGVLATVGYGVRVLPKTTP